MFRNVTMLIPLLAGLLALVLADAGRDYAIAGGFVLASGVVWVVWRVVDSVVTRDQRRSLDQ